MNNKTQRKAIKCLQINLQRSKDSTSALTQFIENNDIDIAFIQEPYVIKGKVCGFPLKYSLYYDNNCETPKSVILCANKSLKALKIQSYTTNICTTVLVNVLGQDLCLFNIYCSPFADITAELEALQLAIDRLDTHSYILCTDSNAHSKAWYDSNNDLRGEIVLDFIAKNDLVLMNNNENESPTYETVRGKSNIDLTLITNNLIKSTIGQFYQKTHFQTIIIYSLK
jgi:hypothetical protein